MRSTSTSTSTSRGVAPLQFVNAFGQPLKIENLATQAAILAEAAKPRQGGVAAKKTPKPPAASRGFEIVGIRASAVKKAETKAADKHARWAALSEKVRAKRAEPVWNETAWLDKQKPKRAMRETFAVEAAAQLAAELLQKQGGWLRVAVLKRGA